jgi:hypothetical protein
MNVPRATTDGISTDGSSTGGRPIDRSGTDADDRGILLTPPSAAEGEVLARGIVSAVGGPAGLTHLQTVLLHAVFDSMTGFTIDPAAVEPISAAAFADALARRNDAFRTRIVQIMLLAAFSVRPLPSAATTSLEEFSDALGVRDDMIDVATRFAAGALDLANIDFARNGYLGAVSPERLAALHAASLESSWGQVLDDPTLTARWASLEELPIGTLGRGVADFYRDRGFVYPGQLGSTPPLLAQHDWTHVLAGYGTALENEIEVFTFMARANDDPRAFSLLAMVLSLFETGYLASGAGLFEANPGHLAESGMAVRLADAMRRGAETTGSHDFLDLDWFALADRPLAVVRAEIGLRPKSAAAVAAGSVGPWETGGITEYQLRAATAAARAAGSDRTPWAPDLGRA